ncbi:DEAD/DEAH box helicase family protein [Williamsoniiplasma luminosum]|uniref:Uncharacterized protein n=1 Tax=Williamsoniiplasma luminosum TaxID=214888 RepID=A0A2S0NJB6_9MOLU|nr:DEAD/DEAH box helicase family protein [Williamsoniiplasma luminosum]AVP49101.1 MAG: hypothetical protein C5T88_00680 [Williamsoniiplasma luminosum]
MSDKFLINELHVEPITNEITKEFKTAHEVLFITPFLSNYGVSVLRQQLLNNSNLKIKIITTTYDGQAKYLALDTLVELKKDFNNRVDVKIENLFQTNNNRIHVKAYGFIREENKSTLYVGSSNFTSTGIETGKEYNAKISEHRESEIFKKFHLDFWMLWSNDKMINITENERIQELILKQKIASFDPKDKIYQEQISMQENALKQLDRKLFKKELFDYQKTAITNIFEREANGLSKHLLVMATGTGKTFTIAEFVCQLTEKENRQLKILYIVHQKEILDQTITEFKTSFKSHDLEFDGVVEFYDGRSDKQEFIKGINIFASMQTLTRNIELLNEVEFDLVIFDEAHHLEADSFKKNYEALEPISKTMIGLTATPERTDGVDICKFFGHEYATELRLYHAIEKDLLSSFEYFFINDKSVDLNGVSLKDENLLGKILSTEKRNEFIYQTILKNIGIQNHDTSTVLFCATSDQAKKLALFLQEKSERANFLVSEDLTKQKRDQIIEEFRTKQINYLCVRDMFNEGIDVPNIDRIFFLRPTNSLIVYLQQLGRGLRKSIDKKLQIFDFVNNVDMEKNKKYDPLLLVQAFKKDMNIHPKDLWNQNFKITEMLPRNCDLYFEEKTEKMLLEKLKQFEASMNFKDVVSAYQIEDSDQYSEYKKMFEDNDYIQDFNPFNFYKKKSLTFLKHNKNMASVFANFASMNIKWVLEEWLEIIQSKKIDLNKISHKLFMCNMCNTKFSKTDPKFHQDLSYFWSIIIKNELLLKEIGYLLKFKLETDLFTNNKSKSEELDSFKNGYFTYNQMAVLFGATIENNAFKSYTAAGGIFKIKKDNHKTIISSSEYTSETDFRHKNSFNPKERIINWESPDDWKYNTNKINLKDSRYFIFYITEESTKTYDDTIREFIGEVESYQEKSLIKFSKHNVRLEKGEFTFKIK